ncbi:MAG: radical SAM protein [Armatimonadetes bacterium]|nr:radical SAM protein [Armatimonadota bacterium]
MSLKATLIDLLPKAANYRLSRCGIVRPASPINITLSVTNMCQSRCKTCNIWEMYKCGGGNDFGRLQDEMTLADFERLFKSIGHVYFVNISGGEPFLRKDFPEIIELANELLAPGVIHTPTNAIMPQRIEEMTEDILQRLLRNGRKTTFTVKPSFDGVGDIHDQIRGVSGNFEKLMDTLERLRKLRSRYPNLEVGAGTVISRFNIDKVPETAEFVHTLGLDSYISEIAEERSEMFNKGDSITPSADEYERAIKIFSQESRKHLTQAGKLGRTTNAFRLVYYDLVVRILREKRQVLPCYGGISNVHISPYGDVWPCCVLGYEKSMGRLSDSDYDFRKIWHSAAAEQVRRYIRAGNCWCPLANQAYSNILVSPVAMARVAAVMLRNHGRGRVD